MQSRLIKFSSKGSDSKYLSFQAKCDLRHMFFFTSFFPYPSSTFLLLILILLLFFLHLLQLFKNIKTTFFFCCCSWIIQNQAADCIQLYRAIVYQSLVQSNLAISLQGHGYWETTRVMGIGGDLQEKLMPYDGVLIGHLC